MPSPPRPPSPPDTLPPPLPPPSLPGCPETASKLSTAPLATVTLSPAHKDKGREPAADTESEEKKSKSPKIRNCILPSTTDVCMGTPKKVLEGVPSISMTPVSVLK